MVATIYDVAERARVSIATVSRVMNGSGHVAAETRDRVLAAAEALGYQPRASARGLALNSTETIAIVFPYVSGPYFAAMISGVETEARQHDYHLLVYTVPANPAEESFLPLLPARVDGMILADRCVSPEYLAELAQRGVPCVLLGGEVPGLVMNTITPENRSGAYQATLHFIDHGYRRIAIIAGPPSSDHSTERLLGYRDALAERDLPFNEDYVVGGDFHEDSGRDAMLRFLDLPEPPEAVLASNDLMAIGAMGAIRSRGLRIPEDVALIGFDDLPMVAYLEPPLTTVRQSLYEMGSLAMRMLLRHIRDDTLPAETVSLPTELVVRRSCGCQGYAPWPHMTEDGAGYF
jgi:DNA-binding LacI/PurR family transcriptional regulator